MMLRRVVRWIVAGVAVALALHLYMLSSHSHQAAESPSPFGLAGHEDALAAHQQDRGSEVEGPVSMVDMLATCLAVLGTLLLGTLLRRRSWPASPPAQAPVTNPSRRRDPPRARLPVELCVSRR